MVTVKRWVLRAEPAQWHYDIVNHLKMPPVFATLLAARKLNNLEATQQFLAPRLKYLVDPLSMLDMEKAVDRLVKALDRNESIAVFGDYDVDGVTSSALLVRYFRALGKEIRVMIPDRLKDGYGPTVQAVRTLAEEGIGLMITVDCGVTAHEALAAAKKVGLSVIVTDHHQQDETIPEAAAVINPNRLEDDFPNKELAGVGVVFYLLMALNRALRERGWFQQGRPAEPALKNFLDLVALGTIADVAPLTALNRLLVTAGFSVFEKRLNVGLQALRERAGLKGTIGSGQVGFQLGPRLNAAGRLGSGRLSCELLITESPVRAKEIAEELEKMNLRRRNREEEILKEASAQIEQSGDPLTRYGLVVAHSAWHPGIIGIVAGRIAERYHRPTAVIAMDEKKGVATGSARSIPGIDLMRAVRAAASHLSFYGGHQAAAGFRLPIARVKAFSEAFDAAIREMRNDHTRDPFQPLLKIDGLLDLAAINVPLTTWLERLQPFGRGNPEPVFMIKNLEVVDARLLKGEHLKCFLRDRAGRRLQAIAFRAIPGRLGELLMAGTEKKTVLDVAGTISMNRYQGKEIVQFTIRDALTRKDGDKN